MRIVSTGGIEICARCVHARTAPARLRGLLGRAPLEPGSGLLLDPCSSVHTCLLRRPLDVVFLHADGTVLRIVHGLRPWRCALRRGARSALELPPGTCARLGIAAGDRLLTVAAASPVNGDGRRTGGSATGSSAAATPGRPW